VIGWGRPTGDWVNNQNGCCTDIWNDHRFSLPERTSISLPRGEDSSVCQSALLIEDVTFRATHLCEETRVQ